MCSFAFEIQDLSKYQGVAVKVFTESDSLHKTSSKKTEIAATNALENLLGKDKKYFDTEYVYYSKNKIELNDKSTWYFLSPPSWNGRRKYNLYYPKNDVMKAGRAGDTLVVAKKSKNEILLLIIEQDSAAEKEFYEHLKLRKPDTPKSKSWLSRLWKTSDAPTTQTMVADDELPELPLVATSDKTFIRRYYSPGMDCENNIISELNQAKKTIDIAVYGINNPRIFTALEKAHKRGVKIRVITDRLESSKKNAKILMAKMDEMGIPVRKNKKHRIMHHKFAIFDGKSMSDGSFNWTDNATKTNAEDCTFSPSAPDRIDRFDYLWNFYK